MDRRAATGEPRPTRTRLWRMPRQRGEQSSPARSGIGNFGEDKDCEPQPRAGGCTSRGAVFRPGLSV
eukprot:15458060-Alexandrium_andersonii.AAC.1